MGKLVAYFAPNQTTMTKQDAYFYAAAVLGLNFFSCVYKHNYYFLLAVYAIKVRAAFCSFMYRKALKLSPAHLGDITIGKIVTLITKDVDTFEAFIAFGNDIWIGFIKTVVVAAVLYCRIGIPSMAGIGFLLLIMPIQSNINFFSITNCIKIILVYLGAKNTKLKMKMCKTTDERLQSTQETLSAIRIIKMYTWEKIFENKITKARKCDLFIENQ